MLRPLEILYQDEWLVAVNKPAGHIVHPSDNPQEDDLVTMKILRDQIGQKVYNIHRIDRPTCGTLLFGICPEVAKNLHRSLELHKIEKTYLAIAHGTPPEEHWECHEPLRKHDKAPIKEAHTSFQVLEKNNELVLLSATPHTGRTHQIRKHLLHSGIPILGDYRYAGIDVSDSLGIKYGTGTRMLLQSYSLAFTHPVTEKRITIKSPPDPLFKELFSDVDFTQDNLT